MSQLFKLQNDKVWKTLLLTQDSILLVNKSYNTEEEFMEKFQEKAFLKQRLEIPLADVSKITHPEKPGSSAKITYPHKNRQAALEFIFKSEAEQQQFVQAVAKPRKLIASTAQVNVWRAIGPALIGLGLTVLFSFIIYMDAEIIENGGEVDTSGRRTLTKKLFAWLGEMLGTQGTLIVGGALALLCVYFIYKNLKSRPVEVVYS